MVLFHNGNSFIEGELENGENASITKLVIYPGISVTIAGTLSDDVAIGTPTGTHPTHFGREFALPGTLANNGNGIEFTPVTLTGVAAEVTVESE